VTKKDIIYAINGGARSLDDIRTMTSACVNTHALDALCMDCHVDVEEMVRYYGAMADALRR
jgi:NAD(P)H-nitrite reductase large subunit